MAHIIRDAKKSPQLRQTGHSTEEAVIRLARNTVLVGNLILTCKTCLLMTNNENNHTSIFLPDILREFICILHQTKPAKLHKEKKKWQKRVHQQLMTKQHKYCYQKRAVNLLAFHFEQERWANQNQTLHHLTA